MRPTAFDSTTVHRYLQRRTIATLPELKKALGTEVDQTVFRKLKELDSLTSYSHRGRYYSLRELARFDSRGLWSHQAVWFSRRGTLLTTLEALVAEAPDGCYAEELAALVQVGVQDALRALVRQRRFTRQELGGRFLYLSSQSSVRRAQLQQRQAAQAPYTVADPHVLRVPPEELQAAIILFYSVLDEKQRRLYAGLESLKLGHGGDAQLAHFLGLDPHTVARGREQLLSRDIELERVRRSGAGRVAVEKKRPKS
jgi:hypothetical protein